MKALQIFAYNDAKIVEVPKPTPPPGHALIRPVLLSLCASDIYMYKYAHERNYPCGPGSSGHEMIGIVEEINGDMPDIQVGDLTLTLSPEQEAMAEYYVAPFENILPVPAGVAPEHLVQAQQIGTVIYASKQLPNIVGKSVAVIGQGSAGQWWNFVLRRMGASHVIGIDIQAHRLQISHLYGATHTIHNKTADPISQLKEILHGQLPEIVIEAAGEIESINLAIKIAAEYGFILQFGVPHAESFDFDYRPMFRKCLHLKSVVYATREPNHTSTRQALNMIASGEIDVAPIVTHKFKFQDVLDAYELQYSRDEGAIKIIVEMPVNSG